MTSSPRSEPGPVKALAAQGMRFIVVGAVNTLGTLVIYELLLFVLPYTPSYALSWLAGLIFVNIAYPRFVYSKSGVKPTEVVLNSVYYGLSFVVSWGLLYLFTARLGIYPRLSIFCVLVVMVPLNFVVTRYIYRPVNRATT